MTADEVLKTVSKMPREDWVKIQRGLADLFSAQFTTDEREEIQQALAESEAEYGRGEGIDEETARHRLGLA